MKLYKSCILEDFFIIFFNNYINYIFFVAKKTRVLSNAAKNNIKHLGESRCFLPTLL